MFLNGKMGEYILTIFWYSSITNFGCEHERQGEQLARIEMSMDNNDKHGDDTDVKEGEQANEEEEEESQYEDEDNIIDGCHVLDVNIAVIETSIWVRADSEYIRVFDHIAKLYKEVVM
jgi:hypothetical protein